jgi:hypothetical protein
VHSTHRQPVRERAHRHARHCSSASASTSPRVHAARVHVHSTRRDAHNARVRVRTHMGGRRAEVGTRLRNWQLQAAHRLPAVSYAILSFSLALSLAVVLAAFSVDLHIRALLSEPAT